MDNSISRWIGVIAVMGLITAIALMGTVQSTILTPIVEPLWEAKYLIHTGVIDGGELTINVNDTLFDIAEATCMFVDKSYPQNPTLDVITIDANTGLETPYLTTASGTFVGYYQNGTVETQVTDFTRSQLNYICRLGRLSHFGRTVITGTYNFPLTVETNLDFANWVMKHGVIKVSGLDIQLGSDDLGLKRTAGSSLRIGAGGDIMQQNFPESSEEDNFDMLWCHRNPDGTTTIEGSYTVIDTEYYDDGSGTLQPLSNGKFGNIFIYFFPSDSDDTTFMIRDDTEFNSLNDAILGSDVPPIGEDIAGGIVLAVLSVKRSTTNLSKAIEDREAKITSADAFGCIHGVIDYSQLMGGTLSTGLLSGGLISINSSDNSLVDVIAGEGIITDYTNMYAPMVEKITWENITVHPDLTGIRSKWIGVQKADGEQAEFVFSAGFTALEKRSIIIIGRVWGNGTDAITGIGQYSTPAFGSAKTLEDLISIFGSLNLEGNVFIPNGANMMLDKTAGGSFRFGAAFKTSPISPNIHSDDAMVGITSYQYHLQNKTVTYEEPIMDSDYYDLDGVKTLIHAHDYQVQRVYYFPVSQSIHVTYGQVEYGSMEDAIQGIGTEPVVLNDDILTGAILRAYVVLEEGATDLSNPDEARIITVTGLGGGGAGGGVTSHTSLTDLDADDHLQYLLVDGSRDMTGGLTVNENLNVDGNLDINGYAHIGTFHHVLDYSSVTTPTYGYKIQTNLPWSAHMPTIFIDGYAYNVATPIDLQIVYYIFGDEFVNYKAVATVGSWRPTIQLSRNIATNKVVIYLSTPVYYGRFHISGYMSSWNENPAYWEGWSVTDADLTGCDKTKTVPYASNIADDVSCTNCLTSTEVASSDIAYDLSCTDCIGTTEIADSYVLNTGDTINGQLVINAGNDAITLGTGTGLAEIIYDSDSDWFTGTGYSGSTLGADAYYFYGSGGTKFEIDSGGEIYSPFYTTCNIESDATGKFICGIDDVGAGGEILYTKLIQSPASDSYDKIRLYSSDPYAIGMHSAMTFGGLNDWATTFTMNNDPDRGWLWRDNEDSQSDGAMSLTTGGILTVKDHIIVPDSVLPKIVLDSTSAGDVWTSQGAYITIGESGDGGSANMHMTYRGDGYGYIGSGALGSDGIPDASYLRFAYSTSNIYTPDTLTVGNLECSNCVDSGEVDSGSLFRTYYYCQYGGYDSAFTRCACPSGYSYLTGGCTLQIPTTNNLGNYLGQLTHVEGCTTSSASNSHYNGLSDSEVADYIDSWCLVHGNTGYNYAPSTARGHACWGHEEGAGSLVRTSSDFTLCAMCVCVG